MEPAGRRLANAVARPDGRNHTPRQPVGPPALPRSVTIMTRPHGLTVRQVRALRSHVLTVRQIWEMPPLTSAERAVLDLESKPGRLVVQLCSDYRHAATLLLNRLPEDAPLPGPGAKQARPHPED